MKKSWGEKKVWSQRGSPLKRKGGGGEKMQDKKKKNSGLSYIEIGRVVTLETIMLYNQFQGLSDLERIAI